MGNSKVHHFICFLWIAAFTIQPYLYGQDYLSKDRESEIKMSGKYYWGEGSDFDEESAKLNAFNELSNHIIQDAVGQSKQQDETIKAIQMGVHLGRLPQQGKIKIITWIAKDSVLLTVMTQRPITQSVSSVPFVQNEEDPIIQSEHIREKNPIVTDNLVLQELIACHTYNEIRRVANKHGLVRGSKINSSDGFTNPEKCIIAVFSIDGTLMALLDTGGNSRTDLLSGEIIQNPVQHYNRDKYFLWYIQQKNN